ncbi:Protein T16G12.1 [Aphelenchoides avenae]|nr:Protein T16G12.1 [Aphelenchus avenae]
MEGYLDYALRSTAGCIVAMKEYTQMDFGLPKLDVLAVPALNIGAMENWGLIISSHSAVYANPLASSPNWLWGIASTQCHETVHQWFGDLVTADRWGDLFLHESLATYFETTMTKRFIPAEHHRIIESKRVKQVGRGLNTADYIYHPLVYNQSDFRYVYQPGAAILNTVEWAIGEDAFRRALRRYLQQHRLGNAVYRDLANAFLEESRHVSFGACSAIVNHTHFLDTFFLQPSYPLITVEHSSNGYVISQAPYNRSNVEKNGDSRSWDVPLLSVHADGSYGRYWISGSNTCAEQPRPSELKFVLGQPYSPFARMRYDNETFEALKKAIFERPDLFDDNHLLRLFYDEFSFLADNESLDPFRAPRIMLDRLNRAGIDGKISASLFTFIMGFTSVADEYLPPPENERFRNTVLGALERLYKNVGWNVNSDKSWDERTLQSVVLFHAVYFEVNAAIEDAQHYLERFLDGCFFSGTHHNVSDCNSLHVDIRQAVYCAAFKRADNDTISLLTQYLNHFEQDPISGYLEPQVDEFRQAKCLPESSPTVRGLAGYRPHKWGHSRRGKDVMRFPAVLSFGQESVQRI